MLSSKALIVDLKISQWTGRKLDKRATGSVEVAHATDKRVGNYTKKLLPGARELEQIQAIAGSIRTFYYENTLPWLSDGSRLLSSKNYLDFVREFAQKRDAFELAVDAFLTQYPNLRASAQAKLGDLFNVAEYPSETKLRGAFVCNVRFMPVPEVSDFRTEVLDSEKESFLSNMREVEANATRECFERLSEVVSKAVKTLNQPDAIFRDSLIKNISSICQILPKLNVMDDSTLEKTRVEVEALVASINPDLCRDNANERQNAAKKLAEVNARMGAFMGSV